jgi:hypothetical protein
MKYADQFGIERVIDIYRILVIFSRFVTGLRLCLEEGVGNPSYFLKK